MKKYIAGFLFTLSFLPFANADLLVGWNFNNVTSGTGGNFGTFNTTGTSEVFVPIAEQLNGASNGLYRTSATLNLLALTGSNGGDTSNNYGTFAGDAQNAVGGDVAGQALAMSGTLNNTSSFTFTLPTTNYQDLVLSYATRGTATGFSTHVWAYSTDGTTFTDFSTITGRNVTTFSIQTVDFSSVSIIDNSPSVFIRATVSGATSSTGNNRFDNVQFNATAVPEASAVASVFIGGALLIARRRMMTRV